MSPILIILIAVAAVFALVPVIVNAFLRNVNAGEIRLVSWMGGAPKIFRGPCKATLVPLFTVSSVIPAQAINVDIEITDQTADIDATGRPAPVKVTVRASAIVSVGENNGMVNTAANKFFSKPPMGQLSTLTDVLSSAGRRAINLLKHDQLFNARSGSTAIALAAQSASGIPGEALAVARGEDDELGHDDHQSDRRQDAAGEGEQQPHRETAYPRLPPTIHELALPRSSGPKRGVLRSAGAIAGHDRTDHR